MTRLSRFRNLRGLGDFATTIFGGGGTGAAATMFGGGNTGDPNYMPPPDYFTASDGCVYDEDGNRLTCPGGVAPGSTDNPPLLAYQAPTEDSTPATSQDSPPAQNSNVCSWDADGNLVAGSPLVCAPHTPGYSPDASASARRSSIGNWLNQPLAKGWPSNGTLVLGALGVAVLANLVGGRRRRR